MCVNSTLLNVALFTCLFFPASIFVRFERVCQIFSPLSAGLDPRCCCSDSVAPKASAWFTLSAVPASLHSQPCSEPPVQIDGMQVPEERASRSGCVRERKWGKGTKSVHVCALAGILIFAMAPVLPRSWKKKYSH